MVRIALIALALLVAVLVVVSLLPEGDRSAPDDALLLQNATVTLFPQVDADAVWSFEAPEVAYDPSRRETTLTGLERGSRSEDGEVDFRLRADEILIDADEDLRSDGMQVRLEDDGTCLLMAGGAGAPVLVDQREGVFVAPEMRIQGEDWDDSRFPNVTASFDLERFEAGGAGTTTVTSLFLEGSADGGTACDDFDF